MISRCRLTAFALVTSVLLLSCQGDDRRLTEAVTLQVAQSHEKFPEERGCWTENVSAICPVIVTQDGDLTHRGSTIAPHELVSLARNWNELGYPILGVAIHPLTRHAQAVEQLSKIDEALPMLSSAGHAASAKPRFALMEWEKRRYKTAVRRRNLGAATELQKHEFAGQLEPYSLPVLVGFSEQYEACVFKVDGITLSSDELNDLAFHKLDRLVRDMGGDNAASSKPSEFGQMIARVQVHASTPWRCVAGAPYHVQNVGWSSVRYEVVEDTRS